MKNNPQKDRLLLLLLLFFFMFLLLLFCLLFFLATVYFYEWALVKYPFKTVANRAAAVLMAGGATK